MPRSNCPDPALLQAYADGTLFSRDVPAVEQHVAGCQKCGSILAAMRQAREAASASTWSQPRVIGAAAAAIVVGGIATWAMWPGSSDAPPSETAVVTQPETPAAAPSAPAPATQVESPPPTPAVAPATAPEPVTRSKAAAPPRKPPAPPVAEPRQPVVKEPVASAEANTPAEIAQADGVILRGTRRSNRRVVWRARDFTIEHSTDGGMTWATEYTTDRPIRAGAFVSADVAWLVGESGLVLRRTKNGWFGATPPGDGNLKGIRASSPSKATVTFDDGRVFVTENGGVTWASQ
jgi:hypothetical protein